MRKRSHARFCGVRAVKKAAIPQTKSARLGVWEFLVTASADSTGEQIAAAVAKRAYHGPRKKRASAKIPAAARTAPHKVA